MFQTLFSLKLVRIQVILLRCDITSFGSAAVCALDYVSVGTMHYSVANQGFFRHTNIHDINFEFYNILSRKSYFICLKPWT